MRWSGWASLVGCVLLVMTACQPADPNKTGASQAPAQAQGGRIVEGFPAEITNLQPLIVADNSESVWSQFYLPLLRSNPDTGDLEAGLAQTFSLSADGLTVNYQLRDGLVWSDGVAFTGDDYKYTIEAAARSKKAVRRAVLTVIDGFQDYADGKSDSIRGINISPDTKTITIKLTRSTCAVLRQLAGAGGAVLPMHSFVKVWDNKTTDTSKNIDDNPLNLAPPASMGPFVFTEFKSGDHVSMRRNDKYYRGPPLVDEYVVKVYSNQAAAKVALLAGDVSFVDGIDATDVKELQANPNLTFSHQKGVSSATFIVWNVRSTKAPWLGSKEVRQALWYALDVKSIIAKVVLGYGTQLYAHTPPGSWAYDESTLTKYTYDPDKAKVLLEQAGAKMGSDGVYRWKDGQPMQMRIEAGSGSNTFTTILQVIQEEFKAVGVKIDAQTEGLATLLDRIDPTNVDREGVIFGWDLPYDPDAWPFWHSSNQRKGGFAFSLYTNPVVDKALEAARFGPDCSTATRKQSLVTFNQLINADAPFTFLYAPEALSFASRSVHGFGPRQYSPVTTSNATKWNIETWSVGP